MDAKLNPICGRGISVIIITATLVEKILSLTVDVDRLMLIISFQK